MVRPEKRSFYQGLRFKLLLVSLTLLTIPWAGYRYITEIEIFLRNAQEEVLLGRAEMVANILTPQIKVFLLNSNRPDGKPLSNVLYVHPLDQPIQLDGYPEEWYPLLAQGRVFRASESNPQAAAFDLLIGHRNDSLYLLVLVKDVTPIYARSDRDPASGDHLLLALPGSEGKTRQYSIGTQAPGWVMARTLATSLPAPSIRGEWQETKWGYTIELRLPLKLAEGALSLALVDKDSVGQHEISGIAATSGLQRTESLSRLLIPSPEVNQLLHQMGQPNTRIRILNRQRLVIAQNGRLDLNPQHRTNGIVSSLLSLILPLEQEDFHDKRENLGRLDGPEIRTALNGRSASYRYQIRDNDIAILSAAYPIIDNDQISGAVMIEQTTHEMLAIQHGALVKLAKISLVLFLLTGISLLFFASRLTGRIRRLSQTIDTTVSGDGRISRELSSDAREDEIGDLERSFASVMQRLREYNSYLEAMASRLAHEFRTPLVMVKSSLENLEQDDDPATRARYLARASEGTERLANILDRMREATRLEQALQMAEQERVNLSELVEAVSDNYISTYPATRFECRVPDQAVNTLAAPELIVQALDKLVSNAVDFHTKGTPIVIELGLIDRAMCQLKVSNQGPKLPAAMELQLFDSMVSVRGASEGQPHLGLGLYLVRLITEFHLGVAKARNTAEGVSVSIELPLHQTG
ncbi:MAG: ATP-binding protein [Pseudomonadota bacterium]